MNTLRISRVVGFGSKPPQDFDQSPITLGTASSCTIRFDPAFDRGVAAQHARLEWNGEAWYLLDLGSPEGTWVDGLRLAEARAVLGPLEFSLGQNGPKVRIEPLATPSTGAGSSVSQVVPPAPASVSPSKSASQKTAIFGALAAVLVLVLGGGIYWLFRDAGRPSFDQTLNGPGGSEQVSPSRPDSEEEAPAHPSPRRTQSVTAGLPAMGLNPPSAAERSFVESSVPTVEQVGLNSLAVQRGAKSSGKGALAAGQSVTFGHELRSVVAKTGTVAKSKDSGLQLPAAVDNSTLPCFPPITSQGQLGSCASFSMAYYTASHNTGLVHHWAASTDPSRNFSPKWTYTMVNGGKDGGSTFLPIMNFLQRHGAPTLAEWPYSGDPGSPVNYREWPTDPKIWQSALGHRIENIGTIRHVDTPGGLQNLKAYLANGYIGSFGTSVGGWRYAKSKANPGAPGDAVAAGQDVCYYIGDYPGPSGHAMTVVGYDDNMWVDVNANGTVDPGETGALKIANSWGTEGWAQFDPGTVDNGPSDEAKVGVGGFVWILYDALKNESVIPGFHPADRVPLNRGGGFWQSVVYYLQPSPEDYRPRMLARFTIQTNQRDSLDIRLGLAGPNANKPEMIWRPGALSLPQFTEEATAIESYTGMGGPFGMNGQEGSSTATCVFDLTDLLNQIDNPDLKSIQCYLMVNKLSPDAEVTIKDYSVLGEDGKVLSESPALSGTIDSGTKLFKVDVPLPHQNP